MYTSGTTYCEAAGTCKAPMQHQKEHPHSSTLVLHACQEPSRHHKLNTHRMHLGCTEYVRKLVCTSHLLRLGCGDSPLALHIS